MLKKIQGFWNNSSPATRKKIAAAGILILVVLCAPFAWRFFTTESTDDAYVTGHVHTISPRVNGTVVKVNVTDNQNVKKGDVLVELDRRDFEVQVKIAQANYAKAHQDLGRLSNVRLGPDEKPLLDTYTANALVSEAQLENAQLQLEYTKIVAPTDGRVGKKTVESGTLVQAGLPLLALVEPQTWVVANFKETQIPDIRAGQTADVEIDGLPDLKMTAKVDSVAPGSGATFSLIPPDNATGNFTKIVQRVPVKITLSEEDLKRVGDRAITGMSATVRVHVR